MIQFEQKIGKSLVDFGGIKHVQKNCDKNGTTSLDLSTFDQIPFDSATFDRF